MVVAHNQRLRKKCKTNVAGPPLPDATNHAMPEYACEPLYGQYDEPLPPAGKYIEGTFICSEMMAYYNGQFQHAVNNKFTCCGFLTETPPPPSTSASDDRPISFYLAIVAIVYCVVLTAVFTVWACRHPRIPAVSRRVSPQFRYAPQVVAQQPQVVIQPTAIKKVGLAV